MGNDVFLWVEIVRESLKAGFKVELVLEGTSMMPTISPGSTIIISQINEIKCGGIYVFLDDDPDSFPKLVCHRLIGLEKERLTFKGDNRVIPDPEVKLSRLIGEVIYE